MRVPGGGAEPPTEFLAEGCCPAQPVHPAAERPAMVQPVGKMAPGGRPDAHCVAAINVNKIKSFSAELRALLAAPLATKQGGLEVPSEAFRRPPAGREIGLMEGDSPGLAPVEPPSVGPRWEAAEWLSCFTSGGVEAPTVAPAPPAARGAEAEVGQLLERWVRRVGLGGDQRRGVARLAIGAGQLAGAELVVVAEGSAVSVELQLPSDVQGSGLEQRLRSRLERKGLRADVTVR